MQVDVLNRLRGQRPPVEVEMGELYRKIDAVRWRSWRLALFRSACFGAWAWLASLVVLGAAAWLLPIPPVVRLALLVAHVALIFWAVWRGMRRSAIIHRGPREWALRCEELEPSLKNRLVTCVELAGDPEGLRVFETSPVADALLGETTLQVRRFEPDEALPSRRIGKHLVGALLPLLLFLVALFCLPEWSRTLLNSLYNVRLQTTLSSLGDWTGGGKTGLEVKPGNAEVPRGSSVTVEALIQPARVDSASAEEPPILRILEEGKDPRTLTMVENTEKGPSVYVIALHSLLTPTRYEVQWGRKRSPLYTLTPYDPPEIESIAAHVIPPAYTGTAPYDVEGNYVNALTSSTVTLTIRSTRPLLSASLAEDEQPPIPGTVHEQTAVFQMALARSSTVRAEIVDASNHRNENPPLIQLIAREDEPPSVAVQRPGADWSVHRLVEVVLEPEATDDYGLESLELEYRINEADPVVESLFQHAAGTPRERKHKGSRAISFEDLNLQVGDVFYYRFRARDNQSDPVKSEAWSQPYFLTVRPFEQAFFKGGPGGGAPIPSVNEREVIVATTRLLDRRKTISSAEFGDQSLAVSRSQRTVRLNTERLRDRVVRNKDLDNYQERVDHLDKAIEAMKSAETSLEQQDPGGALPQENSALRHLTAATAGLPLSINWDAGSLPSPYLPSTPMGLAGQRIDVTEDKYELSTPPKAENLPDKKLLEALDTVKALAKRQKEFMERIKREKWDPSGGGNPMVRMEKMRLDTEKSRFDLERLRDEVRAMEGLDPKTLSELMASLEKTGQALAQVDEAVRNEDQDKAETASVRAMDELLKLEMNLEKSKRKSSQSPLADIKQRVDQLTQEQKDLQQAYDTLSRQSPEASKEKSEALATRQQQLKDATRGVEQSLKAFQPREQQSPSDNEARNEAEKALGEAAFWMNESAETMRKGDSTTASMSQKASLEKLAQAGQKLDNLLAHQGDTRAEALKEALAAVQKAREALSDPMTQPDSKESASSDSKSNEKSKTDGQKGEKGKEGSQGNNGSEGSSQKSKSAEKGKGKGEGGTSSDASGNGQGRSQNSGGDVNPTKRAQGLSPREIRMQLKRLKALLEDEPQFTDPVRLIDRLNTDLEDRPYTDPELVDIQAELDDALRSLEEKIRQQIELIDQVQRLQLTTDEDISPQFRGMAWKYFEELGKTGTTASDGKP